MRTLLLTVLVATLGATQAAPGQATPGAKNQQLRPSTKKQRAKPKPNLKRFLRARVSEVEWDDIPFGDVIEWLRDLGSVNVVVRWNVLEEHGIDEDSPVSLRLKNVKIATILSETLAQLSEGEELRFIGIGQTLTISTRADLNRKLYVKVYPVEDLLFRIPDFTDSPTVSLEQSSGGGGAGGGSAQQNPFQGGGGSGGGTDDDARSRPERMQNLIELIKQTIEPETWRENGGEATISSFNNSIIVVRASLEVHEKLGGPLVLKD